MTKITDMINELEESLMDENILDNTEMTKDEKQRTASLAISKIRAEKNEESRMNNKNISVKKAFNRKFVALAAAMVVVLAFGAVAYAAGWFNFGKVDDYYGITETASLEDSNQYKALSDYQKYISNLPEEEYKEMFKSLQSEYSKLDKQYGDSGFPVLYVDMDKAKELCDKYNLKLETEDLIVSTVDEMFTKADMPNFLGGFKVNSSSGEGQYSYTDQGAVSIVGNIDSYCDVSCVPNDVFRHITLWHVAEADNKTFEQWDYKTKDGQVVRCCKYEDKLGKNDEVTEENYNFAAPVGDYVVTFTMAEEVKDGKSTFTKEGLEQIIEQFDLSKLDK